MKKINTQTNEMIATLAEIKGEVHRLATEDLSKVGHRFSQLIESRVKRDPYGTLAISLGVGFGIGCLRSADFRNAAVQVGKLVAMRALTQMEPPRRRDSLPERNSA